MSPRYTWEDECGARLSNLEAMFHHVWKDHQTGHLHEVLSMVPSQTSRTVQTDTAFGPNPMSLGNSSKASLASPDLPTTEDEHQCRWHETSDSGPLWRSLPRLQSFE